jgi:hypothetical protein
MKNSNQKRSFDCYFFAIKEDLLDTMVFLYIVIFYTNFYNFYMNNN